MNFKKIDLTVDALGKTQLPDKRIARIVSLFQSGQVRQEIAVAAIRRLESGEDVGEIETTIPAPLDAVTGERDLLREIEASKAEDWKKRGLAPRRVKVDE